MAAINEGNGVTYTYAGITMDPVSMTVPGYSHEEIDLTNLDNTEYMTAACGTLKKSTTFSLVTPFDPALIALPAAASATFAIVFPNSGGTITVYCQLKEQEEVPLENNTRPLYNLTFLVTNLNGTTETGPAYSA